MFKKAQSITLKDTCSALCNNLTVLIDPKRNVGHYAVVCRNIATVSSYPLESSPSAKPVNRPFILRDPAAQRASHIVQVCILTPTSVTGYRKKLVVPSVT